MGTPVLLAATRAPATCLIGTDRGASTRTICDTLARLTGCAAPSHYAPARPGEIQRVWLDSSQARRRAAGRHA